MPIFGRTHQPVFSVKHLHLLLLLLPCFGVAQTAADVPISPEALNLYTQKVCECLTTLPPYAKLNNQTIEECSAKAFADHLEEIQALTDVDLSDMPTEDTQKVGLAMAQLLLKTCPGLLDRLTNERVSAVKDAQGVVNEGAELAKVGKWADALLRYNQVMELGLSKTLFNDRGHIKLQLGDVYGALADFEFALLQDSTYAVAYNNRALAKRKLGDTDGAYADYSKAIALDSTQALFYSNRGFLRYENDDYAEAAPDLRRATELNPGSAEEFHLLGEVHRLTDKPLAECLPWYEKAIALNPKNPVFFNNRGLLYWERKDNARAKQDFQQAIKLDPAHQVAYQNLASLAFEEKAYREALKYANEALTVGDTAVSHLLVIIDALREMGKTKESLAACEEGAQRFPNNASFYDKKALVYAKTGDFKKTVDAYDKSLELYPNDGESLYQRGLAKLKLQDKAGACEDFYAAKFRNHEKAAEAIRANCGR